MYKINDVTEYKYKNIAFFWQIKLSSYISDAKTEWALKVNIYDNVRTFCVK